MSSITLDNVFQWTYGNLLDKSNLENIKPNGGNITVKIISNKCLRTKYC